ncbi:MAG: protein-disulfide reductase DsbD family protein [Planctomycetota bacterium]|nr:protein-disulfide reductase DsbD family protein [Planctomycetota bacterium]
MRQALLALALALGAFGSAHAQPSEHSWLTVTPYVDATSVPLGGALRIAVVLDLEGGYHVNAHQTSQSSQIPTILIPEPSPAVRWGPVHYPAGKVFAPTWAEGESVSVYEGRTVLLVEATVADDAPTGETPLRLKLSYQGCDARSCYPPASREIVTSLRIVEKGGAAVRANEALFREALSSLASAAPPPSIRFEGQTDLAAAFERGLPAYLASLLVFGLLLNLTPCVFPLIPVTMTVFAQQGESRPARVLPMAALYVLGLAATFTLVGVLAALAGRSMGLVLQSPWGVLGVVTVLALMMASTFGAFEIRLPSGAMGKLGARRGLVGSLFMGLVMGLVASPCVGPFLIALITFVAAKGSVALGAVSFFVTGLGLGIPYLFLGLFTGLINRFPRGGAWLIWTKRLMGMMLAGLILYFIHPYVAEGFFWPLVLATFVFAAVYLALLEGMSSRPFTRRFWAARLITGAAILAAGIMVYTDATRERPEVRWTAWQPGALEKAAAEKKPVLLYFGADWCIACKEWHAHIFADPGVVQESARFERIYVDLTQPPEEALKDFAARFQAINPPVVVLIGRDGTVLKAWRNLPPAADFLAALRQPA